MSHDISALNELMLALDSWIKTACSKGAVPVLAGINGDMDTIGSAISLAAANPNMMACGIHQNKLAKKVTEKTAAPFRKINNGFADLPSLVGGVIIVDAASPGQVGMEIPDGIPKCIIDHHATIDWHINTDDLLVKYEVAATTEIITHYLNEYHPKSLTEPVRKLLLAGLIADSGRFKHSNNNSFKTATILLDNSNIDYAKFVEWLESNDISSSERGNLLRGLQRAKSTISGHWNIIHSSCGTLEGKLAGHLLGLGYDIALVSRYKDGETRLTTRASKSATLRGIKLGEIMQTMTMKLGGEGGGHDGAAGWTGTVDKITAESSFIAHVAKIANGDD